MTFHIVISVILILLSFVYFDYEFSALRGGSKPRKVFGQAMFSIWFALITALALSIPLILEILRQKWALGLMGQFVLSCIVYVAWFLVARWLYGRVMESIYHGTVTGDYRCRVACDDADITPE